MRSNKAFFLLATGIMVAVSWAATSAWAQSGDKFKARLSVIPIASANSRNTVDGIGAVTATLSGGKLTINGTFEGLKSPATIAKVHQGVLMGVRGKPVFDLTVTKATQGNINGTLSLTPEQVQGLRNGHLYIQIHSEGAPDGNLWGWLLK